MPREPFVWLEIDMDGCGRTFGQGACPAVLGSVSEAGLIERKCWNTFATCRAPAAFLHDRAFRTLRYCQPRSNPPMGVVYWPAMDGEPSEYSASVNIAGSDSDLSAFGRRATVSVTLTDFPDHDRLIDPYQAERVSGAAQANGVGYDPASRGTHFGRLKRRWPHYSGRPLRVCHGYMSDGQLVDVTTRHYVITNISGPDESGRVVIEGSDVLDLADDKRTAAPAASNGVLLEPIEANSTTLTLTPTGVGDREYPASGRARIGSEIVQYTRSGDVVTLTGRGLSKTERASHSAGDTFQVVLSFRNARIDNVVRQLLLTAGVDSSFIPFAAWQSEVNRWLSGTTVTRDITEPTGIKALISSLVPLGFSVWWESETQTIRLKANRPVDGDPIWDLSDRNNHLAVEITDDDKKRVADVLFWTVQKDPTKSATSTDNYARVWSASDLTARAPFAYGSGEVKSYTCPWLNEGADAIVRVAARRLLKRFDTTPKYATLTLDAKDRHIRLTDVIRLTTAGLQDETGATETALYQVTQRSEAKAGERIRIVAQSYQFSGRFGYATPNDSPTYLMAAPAQRDPGMFACDPVTLRMPNGDPPYEAI